MPSYEVHGKGKDTGRKRNRIYSAFNEKEARQLAESDGTLVEQVIEVPPEPPTDRQLKYAQDLGITIPENASKDDLRDLISQKVDHDKPSTKRHRKFAQTYGLETTQYIGKKSLFNKIHTALSASQNKLDLLEWFTFRVYRELVNGIDNAPIDSPKDPVIKEIAKRFVSEDRIVKSILRYKGKDLIWFGEWTSPDGTVHNGGSNRTAAYKEIAAALKEKTSLPKSPESKTPTPKHEGQYVEQKAGGNNVLIVVFLIIAVVLIFYFMSK